MRFGLGMFYLSFFCFLVYIAFVIWKNLKIGSPPYRICSLKRYIIYSRCFFLFFGKPRQEASIMKDRQVPREKYSGNTIKLLLCCRYRRKLLYYIH